MFGVGTVFRGGLCWGCFVWVYVCYGWDICCIRSVTTEARSMLRGGGGVRKVMLCRGMSCSCHVNR